MPPAGAFFLPGLEDLDACFFALVFIRERISAVMFLPEVVLMMDIFFPELTNSEI